MARSLPFWLEPQELKNGYNADLSTQGHEFFFFPIFAIPKKTIINFAFSGGVWKRSVLEQTSFEHSESNRFIVHTYSTTSLTVQHDKLPLAGALIPWFPFSLSTIAPLPGAPL